MAKFSFFILRKGATLPVVMLLAAQFFSFAVLGDGFIHRSLIDKTVLMCEVDSDGLSSIAINNPVQAFEIFRLLRNSHVFFGTDYNFRTVERAPDGRVSVQYNVPVGNVPHTSDFGKQFPGNGVANALLVKEFWIPKDFDFPTECRYPGQGRWPMGLWIGPPDLEWQPDGGGIAPTRQRSISVRMNRSGASSLDVGQGARFCPYSYHLNRALPNCLISNSCSVFCPDALDKCYGGVLMERCSNVFLRDRWVTVKLEVRMNTEGKENGCIAYSIDEDTPEVQCGFDFGTDFGWKIQGFYGYSMWHCDGSKKVQKMWTSNHQIFGTCLDR